MRRTPLPYNIPSNAVSLRTLNVVPLSEKVLVHKQKVSSSVLTSVTSCDVSPLQQREATRKHISNCLVEDN